MDANQDGKISYEEFLTMEFKIALTDKEPEAVAEKADTEQWNSWPRFYKPFWIGEHSKKYI